MRNIANERCREHRNPSFIFSNLSSSGNRLRDIVEKYDGAREAAGNMAPERGMLDK
jgi:hypothetical protein